jgi:hypothetical protein
MYNREYFARTQGNWVEVVKWKIYLLRTQVL